MNKKTILAFVLIGIVIALTPMYQRWIAGRTGQGRPEESELIRSEPADSVEEAVGSEEEIAWEGGTTIERGDVRPVEGFGAREVVMENEVVRGTVSTRGGIIVSWVLKGFLGIGDGPVELIPEGGGGPGIVVEGWDLSEEEFVPDQSGVSVRGEEGGSVTLVADLGEGRRVTKRFSMGRTGYDIGLEVGLIGFSSGAKCALVWKGGIAVTEPDSMGDLRYTKLYTYMGGEPEPLKFEKNAKVARDMRRGRMDWVGVRNKYFLVSVIPEGDRKWEVRLSGRMDESGGIGYDFEATPERTVGEPIKVRVYVGPLSYEEIKGFGVRLEKVMDWGWRPLRFVLEPISKMILKLFVWLHFVIPNYGVVIVIFSVLIKIVVYPLTHKSYEASARMQRIQPKIAALRERHGNDRERMNREMMRLYREEKVNPLGGCLPMLLQMPIFFALYNVFRHTIELRRAVFVPGWIEDLSQPEMAVVHVLPLLMCGSMFLQQKTMITDPKQATMMYVMPVMMLLFFWNMPSGLVLYWTMFNLLSWVQQRWLMRSRMAS